MLEKTPELSRRELLELCAKIGAKGYKTKNKAQLLEIYNRGCANISPLRYAGGKTRACKVLDEVLGNFGDMGRFSQVISPFFGGGSFEFHLQNKYGYKINANDKFAPLANFWDVCKNNRAELCERVRALIGAVDKDMFADFRARIMDEPDNINRAVMYFVINRCSFSGATLSGGFSQESSTARFTQSCVDRLNSMRLDNCDISCLDFEEFIGRITMVYCS
jgi:DNA adenine methylase